MAQFMILIYGDESGEGPTPGTAEFADSMAPWMEFNAALVKSGRLISGSSLAPTATARTVRRAWGQEPTVVDGPFTETKEALGGFYLVEAADLDEAVMIAHGVPVHHGSVEVRAAEFSAL